MKDYNVLSYLTKVTTWKYVYAYVEHLRNYGINVDHVEAYKCVHGKNTVLISPYGERYTEEQLSFAGLKHIPNVYGKFANSYVRVFEPSECCKRYCFHPSQ